MIDIELANRQSSHPIDPARLAAAARLVLQEAGIAAGTVSIAVVDDPTMHQLNRQYLAHDYPTDVLSFLLDRDQQQLEGEVIVSADTAASRCTRYGWSPADELLLYVIHGLLHLVGYDDTTPDAQAQMRARERHYLQHFQLQPQYDEREPPAAMGEQAVPPPEREGGGL